MARAQRRPAIKKTVRKKRPAKPRNDHANKIALEETIADLRNLGRVKPIHAAAIAVLRSMAKELDAGGRSIQLFKAYAETLKGLMGDGRDDGDGRKSRDELLDRLSTNPRDKAKA